MVQQRARLCDRLAGERVAVGRLHPHVRREAGYAEARELALVHIALCREHDGVPARVLPVEWIPALVVSAVMTAKRRAIAIVRVSDTAGRNGERLISPQEQRGRIEAACEREGISLIRVEEELDVSGGLPLAERKGLRSAVEAVEAAEAEVIIAAYLDRLVRSVEVQLEVIRRVEAAGGEVLTVDMGALTGATAQQWLSSIIHGAMSESYRRTIKERSAAAIGEVVAAGRLPYPNVPAGYEKNDDRKLVPSSAAPVVAQAFRMRADGATIEAVTAYLRANGVQRSWYGVQKMLGSRVYLGEIHFGQWVNLSAHPAIVAPDVWRRVQKCEAKRGPQPKSDRLLARTGVLRCGTCGTKLTTSGRTKNKKTYPHYRCPSLDCTGRVTISARVAERIVTDAVRSLGTEGSGSAEATATDAKQELEQAEQALDGAIAMLTGLEDVRAAQERLADLRQARDDAQGKADQANESRAVVTTAGGRDWHTLSLDDQRALIRATIESATVRPGRGEGRIKVKLR